MWFVTSKHFRLLTTHGSDPFLISVAEFPEPCVGETGQTTPVGWEGKSEPSILGTQLARFCLCCCQHYGSASNAQGPPPKNSKELPNHEMVFFRWVTQAAQETWQGQLLLWYPLMASVSAYVSLRQSMLAVSLHPLMAMVKCLAEQERMGWGPEYGGWRDSCMVLVSR